MVVTQKSAAVPPNLPKPSRSGSGHGQGRHTVGSASTSRGDSRNGNHPPQHHQRHSKVNADHSLVSIESSLTNSVTDSVESDFIPASLAIGSGPNVVLMCLDNNLATSDRAKKTESKKKNENGQVEDDDSLVDRLASALHGNSIMSNTSGDNQQQVIRTAGKGGRKNTGGVASTSTLGSSSATTVTSKTGKSIPSAQNGGGHQSSVSSAASTARSKAEILAAQHSQSQQQQQQQENDDTMFQPNATPSILFAPPVIAPAPPTASTAVSDISQQAKTDSTKSPQRLRLPNGRRMTKAEEKFHRLTKFMPGIKLDRRMRQTIIQSMKEINCWSDSEEEEDGSSPKSKKNKNKNKSSQGVPRQSSMDLQEDSVMTSMTPKVTFAESVGSGKGSPRLNTLSLNTNSMDSDSGNNSPLSSPTRDRNVSPLRGSAFFQSGSWDEDENNTSPGSMTRTIDDLSQPTSIRQRVTLVKPKQIQESQALMSLEERKRLEREAVRENLIQKAIHLLVELRKEQDETQHMNVVSLLKEQSSSKYVAVKRVVFGLVDRAIKRAKGTVNVQMEKLIAKHTRYQQRVREMGLRLLRIYRRYRFRKYCYAIMAQAKLQRREKYLAEQAELYAFRQRIAQRKLEEDKTLKTWKKGQKKKSTFPMKEKPRSEIPPVVMAENGDVIVSTSVDRKLLSQDKEDTRPDLAPFSTMINNMIYKYVRPVPDRIEDLVDTNNGYQFNEKQTFVHVSTLSPRPPPNLEASTSREPSHSLDLYDDFHFGGSAIAPPSGFNIGESLKMSGNYGAVGSMKGKGVTFAGRRGNIRSAETPTLKIGTGSLPSTAGSFGNGYGNNIQFNTPIPSNAVIIQPPELASSNPYFATAFNRETGNVTRSLTLHASDSNNKIANDKLHPAPYHDVTLVSKYQVEVPMWEQMARLDYVPPVKTVQAEKKNKSAAYRALEKLCGLTEEDIKLHKRSNFADNALGKRPSDHMPLYNTNLLSLFK